MIYLKLPTRYPLTSELVLDADLKISDKPDNVFVIKGYEETGKNTNNKLSESGNKPA